MPDSFALTLPWYCEMIPFIGCGSDAIGCLLAVSLENTFSSRLLNRLYVVGDPGGEDISMCATCSLVGVLC